MAIGVSLPAPLVDNKIAFYALIWLLLFFGAFILPTLTGIMLNSVPEQRRTAAYSVATLFYNLLGYLPAPFIYGTVSTFGKNQALASRFALAAIIYSSLITGVLVILAYRKVLSNNANKEKSEDQEAPLLMHTGDTGSDVQL